MEHLGAHKEASGSELVASSNGRLRLGSVYQLLSRLEDKAVVLGHEVATKDFVKPKIVYRLTESGQLILRATQAAKLAYDVVLKGGA